MFEPNQSDYKKGTPRIPYLNLDNVLSNYEYSDSLIKLLEKNAPELLHRFGGLIIEYAKIIKQKEERLEELESQKVILAGKVALKRKVLEIDMKELPPEPKSTKFERLLSIGLSVLLFLGIIELFDIKIKDIADNKNLTFAALAFAASTCINIGAKIAIENYVYYYIQNKQNQQKTDSFKNYLRESPILVAILIIISEAALAAIGLFGITSNDDWLKRIASIIGSSLGALVNVNLAWSLAIKRVNWKIEFQDEKKAYIKENRKDMRQYERQKAELRSLEKIINRITKELKLEKREAQKEYKRWEKDLKIYLEITQFNSSDSNTR